MRFAPASLVLVSTLVLPSAGRARPGDAPPVPHHVYKDGVYGVAFSPDGALLASSGSGPVRVWEVATGGLVRALSSRAEAVWFRPDGSLLTAEAAPRGSTACVWDAAKWQPVRCFPLPPGPYALSSDGRLVAAGGSLTPAGERLAPVKLFDADTGLERTSFTPRLATLALAFAAGGRLAVFGASPSCASGRLRDCDGIQVWDALAGRLERRLASPPGDVMTIAASPDGSRIVAGESDGADLPNGCISVLDPATGRLTRRWRAHTGRVQALAFSPDGRRLYSGDRFGGLAAWPEGAPARGRQFPRGAAGAVAQLAVSPDGRWLAQADSHWMSSLVVLRDAHTGRVAWSR
jgi:WD40 repeat protein